MTRRPPGFVRSTAARDSLTDYVQTDTHTYTHTYIATDTLTDKRTQTTTTMITLKHYTSHLYNYIYDTQPSTQYTSHTHDTHLHIRISTPYTHVCVPLCVIVKYTGGSYSGNLSAQICESRAARSRVFKNYSF